MQSVFDGSVVVPTIGRPDLLARCLRSVLACEPGPAEVIVADQSAAGSAPDVVQQLPAEVRSRVTVVPVEGRGAARARNVGARSATASTLLFIDDDCAARGDWVGQCLDAVASHPRDIVTGAVLPAGDENGVVPSLRSDEAPAVHTQHGDWSLWSGNMAVRREAFDAVGGFDERFTQAAEDLDLAYRWFDEGRALRYTPDAVVWHADWRGEAAMGAVHHRYARGLGQFYGIHAAEGDRAMYRRAINDVREVVSAIVRGRRGHLDGERRARVPHLIVGFGFGFWQGGRARWKHA